MFNMVQLAFTRLEFPFVEALELTFETLAETDNETVAEVLRAGLEMRDREIAEGALHATLRAKPAELLLELLRRWQHLSERWQAAIAQQPGVLTHAIREAFISGDEQLARNATAAAELLGESELMTFFCTSLEDKRNKFRRLTAETIISIAEKLRDDLHRPRNYESRRDPVRTRYYVLGALEVAAARYGIHRTNEVLEAFLLISPKDNATLRHLLQEPTEAAHAALCDQLLRSTRPGVTNLFFAWLEDPHAPTAALQIMAQRRDVSFFRQLCRKLAECSHAVIDSNLARIESFPWIKDSVTCVDSLCPVEQVGVVRLVAKSRAPRPQIEKLLRHLLQNGELLARPVALRALVELHPEHIVAELEQQLANGIPGVQAEAVKHFRACDVPNALPRLLELLHSPHEVVREAARNSLEEFSFARYLATYEQLTPEIRKASGSLVKRVNPHLAEDLIAEMRASGRARRFRALEIASLLDVVPQVEMGLIELATGEDLALRVEATRLLAQCHSEAVLVTLIKLSNDEDYMIQSIAQDSLQAHPLLHQQTKMKATPPTFHLPSSPSATETCS